MIIQVSVLTILFIGLIPAYADSPLAQYNSGVPVSSIQCADDKILLQSTSGKPYCMSESTATKLVDRGFLLVIFEAMPQVKISETAPSYENTTLNNISDASNNFAVIFYKQISNDTDNIFYSPPSIFIAFSMVYEGAKENTAQQLQDVFGFESDTTTRHQNTYEILQSLNKEDPHATLTMANGMWIADWFELYMPYEDIIQNTYHAELQKVDFSDPNDGIKKINNWASENTNEKIKNIINEGEADGTTAAVITNAIYFKGTWVTEFPKSNTMSSTFWMNSDDSVNTDFMNIPNASFNYVESNGIKVLKMPYKGDRLSMLVILSDKKDGINAIEQSLSNQQINEWNQALTPTSLKVSIPKFEVNTGYDLKPYLQNMGLMDMFYSHLSNLSGIVDADDTNLYFSKAAQGAYVNVNEEGTEAAAVTDLMSSTSLSPSFIADHPFLFLIQDDESGIILFMGRVSDPTSFG